MTEEVITGIKEWRLAHPKATQKEIEQEIDKRLGGLRARMLADVAMASEAASKGESAVMCSQCGAQLEWRGERERRLVTRHDQEVVLKRGYAVCPACGAGVFPPG
jgi:predicted RNA-binding Zn-ribbon protein involved in translation (DUF1610 family)